MTDAQTENPITPTLKFSWGGLLLLLFSGFVLIIVIQQWLMTSASANWPTTQGKVVSSNTQACHNRLAPDDYETKISYQFSISGKLYTSSDVSFPGDQYMGCGHAQEIAAQYPVGKSVIVYYDPMNPQDSVLHPGGSDFIGIAGFLLFFVSGIGLFVKKASEPTK
ncbi:MAG: DUF3592 domain-containing protein [Anaerolineales bacterium]